MYSEAVNDFSDGLSRGLIWVHTSLVVMMDLTVLQERPKTCFQRSHDSEPIRKE